MRRALLSIVALVSLAACAARPLPSAAEIPIPGPTPSPSPIGASLKLHGSGRLDGLSPMGRGASLIIQTDTEKRSDEEVWKARPGEKISFQSTYDELKFDFVVGAPHDPPAVVAPGTYRVGGVIEIFSDVSSEPVPGELEQLVVYCSDRLVVEPSTPSVTIDAVFSGGTQCELTITTG